MYVFDRQFCGRTYQHSKISCVRGNIEFLSFPPKVDQTCYFSSSVHRIFFRFCEDFVMVIFFEVDPLLLRPDAHFGLVAHPSFPFFARFSVFGVRVVDIPVQSLDAMVDVESMFISSSSVLRPMAFSKIFETAHTSLLTTDCR